MTDLWTQHSNGSWSRPGAKIRLKGGPRGGWHIITFDDGKTFNTAELGEAKRYADERIDRLAYAPPQETAMTVDEKALREHLAPFWKKLCATAEIPGIVASVAGDELISLFLAYEAEKPVPASGGVEAAEIKRITDWLLERNREHLYADGLLLRRHAGDAEKFLDTAILLSTLAALASSPATMEAVRELRLALANLTDAFLNRHGCFPLDKTNDKERHWCAAMSEAYRLVGQPNTPARDAALASSTPAEAEPASSPATMEGVRIKPLDWDAGYAFVSPWSGWYLIGNSPRGWRLSSHGFQGGPTGVFDTQDEAKASAQADYEDRILSALSPEAKERS